MAFLRSMLAGFAAGLLCAACSGELDRLGASSDPVTGAPVCDARRFGAAGDGITKDTRAIQAAIEACAGRGGTVLLAHGTFLSGTVRLGSRMVLHIDPTATLKGTQDDADYPRQDPPTDNTQLMNCRKALVYAERADDIHIEGGGTIDGNGNKPDWVYPRALGTESKRPMAIFTALSSQVVIRDIRVKDAAMWGVVNLETERLTISNVTIDSLLPGNRDGIDVVDAHHVLIENSTIFSQDDAICLKTGSPRGVDDVLIKNCEIGSASMANGLKMGTASYGAFRNIRFEDITIHDVAEAAMAVESVDGADIENITFQRIRFDGAGSAIFVILGDRGLTPAGHPHKIGTVRGIAFEDVTGSVGTPRGALITGTRLDNGQVHAVEDVTLTGVHLSGAGGLTAVPADPPEYKGQYPQASTFGDLPASGYFIRHVGRYTLTRSTDEVRAHDVRHGIVVRD